MNVEYTRDEIFQWLENYFHKELGFSKNSIKRYPKDLGPVRVPLYCVKKEDDKIVDEIAVDIYLQNIILKSQFFPTIEEDDISVVDASPVTFYQYYFPKAKIFFAYPDYIRKDEEFAEVKNICVKRGIGLLEVSREGVKEKVAPKTLVNKFSNDIKNRKSRKKKIREILEDYVENYVIRLVYYPNPIYTRRAIIRRSEEDKERISLILIDRLSELKNINYKDKLIKLSLEYRNEKRDDYEIAHRYIGDLWKNRLGLKYPEIQRHFEEILMRDEMYREHFIHQFQVFLIGAYILDKLYETEGFLNMIKSFEEKYCTIEDVWLAASTYHDFNYALQKFDFWLLRFFSDTLSIENGEAKENLNLLNLDAAMVREFLSDIIRKLITLLTLDKNTEKKARKFFYEKAVRDKNHGLLSALSILKLCEIHESDLKVSFNAILQAAFAIACHDEDIWEALSGCKGYLKSNLKCEGECNRKLWKNKEVEVHKQKVLHGRNDRRRCEIWEQEFMEEAIIKKIKFDNWPLLFLLIYCDSVQDEGRITSTSLSNAPIFEGEKRIEINSSLINTWVDTKKKLEEFDQADEIRDAFSKLSYELSNKARIYKHKLSDEKWKIVDENLIYGIEKRIGIGFFVNVRRKECSLSDINVDSVSSKVKIDLAIDGLGIKHKELERISWALNDARFSVHLEEKDTTEESQDIIINGSGGG